MKYEVIDMKIAHSVQATLTIYAHEDYPEVYGERKRPMIVICPGGGYEHVSPREGEAIALQCQGREQSSRSICWNWQHL